MGLLDQGGGRSCCVPTGLCRCPIARRGLGAYRERAVGAGNARLVRATHLWIGVVGDSGNGKSPGADCLMRDVLPEIERPMLADFPERLREWRAAVEFEKAADD